MGSQVPKHSSIFIDDWKKGDSNGKILLIRHVKVGNKRYKMKVGYSQQLLSELENLTQAEHVIKQVMESSEAQIAAFVKSYSHEPTKLQHVSLSTDIRERTGSVALKTLGSPQVSKLSLSDLESRNIQEFEATNALIDAFNKNYTQAIRGQAVITHPLSVRFDRIETKKDNPFFIQSKNQLETLVQKIQPVNTLIDGHGIKRWPKVEIDGVIYEVKEFDENSYNGAKTSDFIRRQQLVFAAIMLYIEKADIHDTSQLMSAISELSSSCVESIEDTCDLDMEQMRGGDRATEYVDETNNRAVDLIAQFTKDAQHLIHCVQGHKRCKIADLAQLEKEIILERDRPVLVNIYQREGKRFINMQAPLRREGKTIPSTIRDRPGLVNYVNSVFGELHDDGHVEVAFHGIRHSSYPPIAIQDDLTRQAITIKNVKEGLSNIARTLLVSEKLTPSKENPLVIPLRTMMLFTPTQGDSVRNKTRIGGKWIGESESLQLKESVFALSMMRGRTMQLEVNGEPVWVKVENSLMNLGANKEAAGIGFGKLPLDSLQKQINARGYFTFLQDMENYFLDQELPGECSALVQQIRELEKSGFDQPDEVLLQENYEQIEREYSKDKPNAKNIRLLQKAIQEREFEINKQFIIQLKERRLAVTQNKDTVQDAQNQFLIKINSEILSADSTEYSKLTKARDLFENFILAKQYFDAKAYREAEAVMEFQTLYMQMQSMIGNSVEFFCKSGEDRTGRVDNKIQERLVFAQLEGRQAVTDEDLQVVHTEVAPVVHHFSVSKDCTTYNSESPGLQIAPEVNPHIPAAIGKKQGTMAKRVIARAEKLVPSSQTIRLAATLSSEPDA